MPSKQIKTLKKNPNERSHREHRSKRGRTGNGSVNNERMSTLEKQLFKSLKENLIKWKK